MRGGRWGRPRDVMWVRSGGRTKMLLKHYQSFIIYYHNWSLLPNIIIFVWMLWCKCGNGKDGKNTRAKILPKMYSKWFVFYFDFSWNWQNRLHECILKGKHWRRERDEKWKLKRAFIKILKWLITNAGNRVTWKCENPITWTAVFQFCFLFHEAFIIKTKH